MTNELKAPDDLAVDLARLAETIEGGGPHEWGYRDVTTGKFMHDDWPFEVAGHLPAILAALTTNDALIAENERMKAENMALRRSWSDLANRINIVGSHYETAMIALDNMVSSVKTQARAALTAGGSHAD